MGGGKRENYKEDTDMVGKGKRTSQCPHSKAQCHQQPGLPRIRVEGTRARENIQTF